MLKLSWLVRIALLAIVSVLGVLTVNQYMQSNDEKPKFVEKMTGKTVPQSGYFIGKDVLITPDISYLVKILPFGTKLTSVDSFKTDKFCNINSKGCVFKVPKPGKYNVYLTMSSKQPKKLKNITPKVIFAKKQIRIKVDSEITSITQQNRTFYKLIMTATGE
jgi:hypothetical protein